MHQNKRSMNIKLCLLVSGFILHFPAAIAGTEIDLLYYDAFECLRHTWNIYFFVILSSRDAAATVLFARNSEIFPANKYRTYEFKTWVRSANHRFIYEFEAGAKARSSRHRCKHEFETWVRVRSQRHCCIYEFGTNTLVPLVLCTTLTSFQT